jgi:glycerol-3-phosphate dehydrogenase
MKRRVDDLAAEAYDLLVIGGGIYGSSIARDAALRGLAVALIERDDFGAATSANSLKIIHGGLRYLKDANLRRVREMVVERKTWLRIAPHLVHPLPCLMPTYAGSGLMRHKLGLAAAMKLNDLVSLDRNRAMDRSKRLPSGDIISRAELLAQQPQLEMAGLTGAAVWHDAQIHNSERLLLALILSAAAEGASVANYAEATGFIRQGDRIVGVRARDRLTGEALDVSARVTVNATGAWVDGLTRALGGRIAPRFRPSLALNLVMRRLWLGDHAVAVHSRPGSANRSKPAGRSQTLFIVPWRDYSVIGTLHVPHQGTTLDHQTVRQRAETLLREANSAFADAPFASEDVCHIQAGFLPAVADGGRSPGSVALVREGRVHDHGAEDGLEGLITVVGVKYTTARKVAEKAVDLVERKLGRPVSAAETAVRPVAGGEVETFDAFLAQARAEKPPYVTADTIDHLVLTYGSEYRRILAYAAEESSLSQTVGADTPVLAAEVIHAVRQEMALTLADVIMRRTELGSAGPPAVEAIISAANLLQSELGWSDVRRQQEIDAYRSGYFLERAS